ncbi:MAG: hypothetical protein EOP53_04635 [Sphingobacteriales bacterium]|nr:MAG: hypothetical protein EOP53_04635 [Sphingobacteriales bacterium]
MVKHNLYTKIFRQLRGYLISPNLNVWKGLRKRLFNKNFPDKISQLKDFSKEPPPELFDQVLETYQQMKLQSKFSKLKDLEERPGEMAFENILAIVSKEKNRQPGIVRAVPFYKRMIAAAALIIVLISCLFLLKTNEEKVNSPASVVSTTILPLKDSTFITDSIAGDIPNNKLLTNNPPRRIKYRRSSFNAGNHLSFYTATIDGNEIPIEDNDLLYSFTNYPYRFGEPNPWNERKGTIVKINFYTGINISPYMSSVISDLYKVKKNGRLTAKARKAKAKIQRWRKTDVKRFDKKKARNPLDIIDLGENVY